MTRSGTVIAITRNYVAYKFKGSNEKSVLSAFEDIQKEHEQAIIK